MRFIASLILALAAGSLLAAQQPVTTPAATATSSSPQETAAPAAPSGNTVNPGDTKPSTDDAGASQDGVPPQATQAPDTVILPNVSKREAEEAKRQFQAGLKLKKKGKLDDAFAKFSSAAELDPRNYDYIAARELSRQELTSQALQRGNKAMLNHDEVVAMAEFRLALQYDPTNDYAQQRLRDSLPDPPQLNEQASVTEQSAPIELQASPQHHDFHFRGDSRTLLTQVTQAYGITAEFDESFKQRRVHFDIDNVNCATAMEAADAVTNSFWIPLSAKQVYFLADTVENRRQFERMSLQTFYVPELTDQQLTEMSNSLRVLLNLRFISLDKEKSTISIRAEAPLVEAAGHLIQSLTTGRPEVLLDMRVFAVSTQFARSLGTALPTQFTLFNISPALLAGLGANAQNLINQLISSGGINQANAQAISALLAQLQNSSSSSSILSQPFVTFGGGLTLFGLTGGGTGVTPTFSLNQSDIRSLEHVTLRASHNDPAVLKIGERYPIVNATFAPIFNSPSIAGVIGNGSFIAPFPSFNFEDLGVNLKATPWIHDNRDVTLKLELQIRSLGTQSVNGIPIINNREYTGIITVKNGESSVVTGLIDVDDSLSVNGYPFLGQIPGLGYGATVHDKNVMQDELLVVITPHILRLPEQTSFVVQLPSGH